MTAARPPVPAQDGPAPADDSAFARWLAGRAGEALLALRSEHGFADPAALRAAGDQGSQAVLAAELARWRPDDAVLSEEAADDPARLDADRVWIIDPLDGTREFAEEGRSDWAVHVALWQRHDGGPGNGGPPAGDGAGGLVVGAVALPAQGVTLATDQVPAYPAEHPGPIRLVASRTRPPQFLTDLAAKLGADIVPMGSAGAKMAAVVQGQVDAYVHAGGQYEWDSAAPVAVALATGLFASRVDGGTLVYNRPNPRLPDVVVCRHELRAGLLDALAELGVGREET